MKRMTTDQLRRSYLDFFVSKGHTEWPSDSLIPRDDPTLLFTGAGMNQFKDMFLGKGSLPFKRATTAQKCLRTGDLDNVGRTDYHHTFFEMMGNFSFGDYFKREAIEWAFEWLTGWVEIAPERLYFSVYEDDDEAWEIWAQVCTRAGLDPEKRIFRLGAHDNFWPADAPEKGPNGPCGPCSEIFFDQEPRPGEDRVDITEEGGRFVEIWNLVFTQFDRRGVNDLRPLPQKNIDTGLGLERMAAVVQGVRNNFEIDVFRPIIAAILERFRPNVPFESLDAVGKQCVRRIADHIRAVTFCITDGALPGNAERGYVVRRLIRRAFLDAAHLKGDYGPVGLAELVRPVVEVMSGAYPDLAARERFVREILGREEEDFIRTLSSNRRRLQQALEEAREVDGRKVVSGETAFRLFDTYGVPVEVMEDYFERLGAAVDREGFERAVERRRRMSREASRMKGDIFDLGPLGKAFDVTTGTEFLGPETLDADGLRLLVLFDGEGNRVTSLPAGAEGVAVLDRTPFYAEAGGQVGDTGVLSGPGGRASVTDCKRMKKVFFHHLTVEEGALREGDVLRGTVDERRRRAVERNHTCTHLLHWALREVVGRHCEQAGSLVAPDRLRFDFTHFSPLSPDELKRVERLVNERIVENHVLRTYEDSYENARRSGVIALFGERYEDRVRVVDIGGFSKELCGGCHVRAVGEIGSFYILAEEAVAAGVRRIEAVTGLGAVEAARSAFDALSALSRRLGVRPDEAPERVAALLDEAKALQRELKALKESSLKKAAADARPRDVAGVPLLALDLGEAEPDVMRSVMDSLKSRVKGGVLLLAGRGKNGVTLILRLDDELVARGWHAGKLIREVAAVVGGKGGGRPQLAQAGGRDAASLPAAFERLEELVRETASEGK